MKIPFKCPVCGGTGLVPHGFYDTTTGLYTSTSTLPDQCRSCSGTGIVWSYEDFNNHIIPNFELILSNEIIDLNQDKNKPDWRIGKYYISETFEVMQYLGCDEFNKIIFRGKNFNDAMRLLFELNVDYNLNKVRKINGVSYFHFKPKKLKYGKF